jgi:hypothetical protein
MLPYVNIVHIMNSPFNIIAENIINDMSFGLGTSSPVTQDDFVQQVIEFDNSKVGTRPISFTSVTTPLYRKTGFPYKNLYKIGQTNGMIGFDYQANVNAQREREGKPADFLVQPSKTIKEWLSFSIGITHRDLKVLRYRPLNPAPSYFVVVDQDGTLKEIENEEAVKYLVPVSSPTNQGIEQTIDYRTYGIDKIVAYSFLKKEHTITDVDPERLEIFNVVRAKLRS